jgi:hypothetical protein
MPRPFCFVVSLHSLLHIRMCEINAEEGIMPTNLAIDDRLIEQAQKLGRHKTKKDTVNAALDEYIRRRKQAALVPLFGTIDYDSSYDYKRERAKKRS